MSSRAPGLQVKDLGVADASATEPTGVHRAFVTVVLGAATFAALLTGCGEETPTEYGSQVRDTFMDQCIGEVPEDAGTQSSEVRELRNECECMYESISTNLSFAEFEDLDADVRTDQVGLPDRVNDLLVRCVIES